MTRLSDHTWLDGDFLYTTSAEVAAYPDCGTHLFTPEEASHAK